MYHDWTIIEYFVQKGRIMDNKTFNSAYYMETKSPSYARTLLDCKRVAASNANVLLIGESGTGKDVAAQYIHALSRRSDKPFIAVNCNAYTESLLEPELFGVEPGIFSDTIRRRVGKFELADHGTLFLDAIGDVSMTTQVKLLRAIETKEIERLGVDAEIFMGGLLNENEEGGNIPVDVTEDLTAMGIHCVKDAEQIPDEIKRVFREKETSK